MSAKTADPVKTAKTAMAIDRPGECTNFKLRQLMRSVTQHYDAEFSRVGLKGTQYSLLSHIVRLGPIPPGELARAMKMDASTLTRGLRPLADAGWVTIGAGADDRSRMVAITESGRRKRQEAHRRWKLAQEKLIRILGEDRVLALHALTDDCLLLLASGGNDTKES
jgi:DNA-binding MarR family transcriptional regulator